MSRWPSSAAALRSYLDYHGELPSAALRAMTPVSVRTEAERSDLGNQVSAMVVSLATDIADPVERLAAVHRSTSGSKEVTEADRRPQPDRALAAGAGPADRARHAARRPVRPSRSVGIVNTVVTNVPGPREPLYFAGARSVLTFGAGPVVDGMGLINIVGSYDEQFVLSFTACREMMPDPARYADFLEQSFDELAAVPAAPRPTAHRSRRSLIDGHASGSTKMQNGCPAGSA